MSDNYDIEKISKQILNILGQDEIDKLLNLDEEAVGEHFKDISETDFSSKILNKDTGEKNIFR